MSALNYVNSWKFKGFKCMIECAYWYYKEINPDFDIVIDDIRYSDMNDWAIYDNWNKFVMYIKEANVACVYTNKLWCEAFANSKYVSRHNGVVVSRCDNQDEYKYVCRTEDSSGDSCFAVIMSSSTRKSLANNPNYAVYVMTFDRSSSYFTSSNANDPDFNILVNSGVTWNRVLDFIGEKYETGELAITEFIHDLHMRDIEVPESIDEASGKYKNIYSIFQGKEKIADRYERLVVALSVIDENLPSKLNYILSKDPTIEEKQVISAIQNSGFNPFKEALKHMEG